MCVRVLCLCGGCSRSILMPRMWVIGKEPQPLRLCVCACVSWPEYLPTWVNPSLCGSAVCIVAALTKTTSIPLRGGGHLSPRISDQIRSHRITYPHSFLAMHPRPQSSSPGRRAGGYHRRHRHAGLRGAQGAEAPPPLREGMAGPSVLTFEDSANEGAQYSILSEFVMRPSRHDICPPPPCALVERYTPRILTGNNFNPCLSPPGRVSE